MKDSLSSDFNAAAQPKDTSALEKILTDWGVDVEKRDDGTLFVPGNVHIEHFNLTELPDMTEVEVAGDFICHDNQLTSLKGAPRKVGGTFDCSKNMLTSLEGAPAKVGKNFRCENNQLTSLAFAPSEVPITFMCHGNKLETLKGAPDKIGGQFWCHDNPLKDLEYAPREFRSLKSNWGEFSRWEDIPEDARLSPETRAQRERELVKGSTVLDTDVQAMKPISFRK
jgi:hypothetical protein